MNIGNNNLKYKTASAITWSVFSSLFIKFVSFGTTVVLARMLTPKEFGLFALAFVIIDGFGLFKSLGFDSALIQRKTEIDKAANTVFFILPFMGLIVYIILLFCAPFIARSFEEPQVEKVLQVLGFLFIINTLTRVPRTILEKNMKFDLRSKADLIGQVFYSTVAVTLAFLGFSIWSLVYGYLAMLIVKAFLIWKFSNWRPNFLFDKKIAIEMFHFGKYLFLGCVMFFLSRSFDRIMVGKLVSISALGAYSIAYNLANLISEYLGFRVGEVLFPLYSKLQSNLYDVKMAYLRIVKLSIIILLPYSFGLLIFGGDFLILVFGEKWIEAIIPLKVLALISISNVLISGNKSVLLGIDKPKTQLTVTLLRLAGYFIMIYPFGKTWGIKGIAFAVLISTTASMILSTFKVANYTKIKLMEFIKYTQTPILATLASIMPVLLFYKLNFFEDILILRFMLAGAILIMTYAFIIFKTEKVFLKEVHQVFIKRVNR